MAKTPNTPLIGDENTAATGPGMGLLPPTADGVDDDGQEAPEPIMRPDGSAIVDVPGSDDTVHIEEMPDGSAIVREDSEAEVEENKAFLANLAETLDPAELARLGRDLLDAIERDKEARAERDKQYAEGIKRTGLGGEAPGGADFQGASRVVHPMIMEGCVDFAARVMKEVFPAKGPVKTQVIGKSNRDKIERAQRKKEYLNWQCTRQIKEFRGTFEQMLTQVPLGGSQFIKVWYDERVERPRTEFIPIDKLHLPFAAVDLYSAERKTHEQQITRAEFESRVASGLYRDLNVGSDSGMIPDETAAEKATNKIEGRSDTAFNEDGLRTVYESYVTLEIDGDRMVKDRPAPYIITVDESSGQVLAIYRNWDEDEETYEELEWIVEAKFLPWRGAYGVGLLHIAGSLSAGATGALRALLDSAHINNFPGGLILKGLRMSGQNTASDPTQLTEIEGPTGIDDIRKIVMAYPFNGPSSTLFQLLEFMVSAGQSVIATAEEKIADATANQPVGTTLALIEQGSVTYSSVHARMHGTMARILAILHRIDAMFLDDEETVEELGSLVVKAEDFRGPMDVVPVSDPNIFSETQRYAQLQAVMDLREKFGPGAFKDNILLEQALRLLNYPQYEDVLNTPLEAEKRTAIEENAIAHDPQTQLEAYDEQDHLEHLKAHITFMASPIFCASPMMAPVTLPKLMDHCREHLMKYYYENVKAAAQALAQRKGAFPELRNDDATLAAAAGVADQEMAKELAPIVQQLQALQQQMQQLIPPPPNPDTGKAQIDAQTKMQIAQLQEQGKAQRDAQKLQADQAANAAKTQQEGQLQQLHESAETQREAARQQAEASRHTEEMANASQNARIAEESERRKQDGEMMRAQMSNALQSALASQAQHFELLMEKMRLHNEQVLTILSKTLDEKAAAAEDTRTVAAAKKESGADA